MRRRVWGLLSLVLLLTLAPGPAAHAGDTGGPTSIDRILINGPPDPPTSELRPLAPPPPDSPVPGLTVLTVPAYDWSSGCSATSAAMIAAYYDRNSYGNIYTGPTNGGVMPLDNSGWPQWTDSNNDTYYQCPLSATRQGLDSRAVRGHVDDYWTGYNDSGPDPYSGSWSEHTAGDCTGDFMKTNKWYVGQGMNVDGATTFYNYTNGSELHATAMEGHGVHLYDGGYGLKLFYESRGYTVDVCYNQYILGYDGNVLGFTWAQYMAEIDAGRPVMIHVVGHTMVGVGYDDTAGQQTIYLHDTWDFSTHTMTWGGSYQGMAQTGVTITRLGLITLVDLTAFEAKATSNRILLEWQTASEPNNAGFNLLRADTKNGPYKKINNTLIPAEGGTTWGALYQFIDDRVASGHTYYYKLEDVDFTGDSTHHGPIEARVRPGGTR